jgi:hypothetical protein
MSDYSDDIRRTGGIDDITALRWLKDKCALVAFGKSGEVVVMVGRVRKKRKTLLEAILAHVKEES